MNQFQHYLLDEFVDDYREGRMSRRDFVRKSIGVAGGPAGGARGGVVGGGCGATDRDAAGGQHDPGDRGEQSDRLHEEKVRTGPRPGCGVPINIL